MEYSYDYLIVGGGIAGLHIASRLAGRWPDRSICIVEKYDTWGGRIHTFTPRRDPKLHYESGAGRISDYHTMVGEYVKKYKLTKYHIEGVKDHRQIDNDGKVTVTANEFSEIISEMTKGFPAEIREGLGTTTIRKACETVYGKQIVDRVFDEFAYRGETELLRGDLAVDTFKGFMGEKGNYYVVAEGLQEIPRLLAKDNLEAGVRLLAGITVTGCERTDGHWLVKGTCDVAGEKKWLALTRKLIFATPRNALAEIPIFKNSWLVRQVQMLPLCRIYATFPLSQKTGVGAKVWFHDIPTTTTNDALRYVIPVNKEKGVIMITYTDGKDTEAWTLIKEKEVREKLIMEHVRSLFPEKEIPDPIAWSYHPWKDGCSYWLPSPVGPEDPHKAELEAHYPFPAEFPGIYVCGESWSCCQAWIEGALRHAEKLFIRHLSTD
jgi:hypothetical protein